ncbi:AbrB family transcriptional regulator [Allosediminivita pacifica]|uniref:Ammonia monooxygenase n=1 Tax=Allosediminivita pacifica TaxID=1267769 RepID=A0A2T6B2E3_9RHOB|nr:AbrB family transcriptional regulator [Allosediminivita pacifica]PTX50195.1 hypothetical protein C8N44_10554 [Allosediminivita pacifica]
MGRFSTAFLLTTCVMLSLGATGGGLAVWLGLPMPWMLGSLIASGALVLFVRPRTLETYVFPEQLRVVFVALIGVMIGTQVTPELAGLAGELPVTMVGLAFFVVMAHGGNALIFRRIGGYSRATAFYAATPGGLMESIMLGEGAGADTRILTAQQFLRIILVITFLPLGLSLWVGEPVGSAAGMRAASSQGEASLWNVLLIFAAAGAGLAVAHRIHLPAAQLTGPLLIAATCTVTGVVDLHLPVWLIALAQMVIGVTLGLRFHGTDMALLRRCAWLAVLSVVYMLLLGGSFAVILHMLTGIAFLHLFISFAPGGVAEMSVIALSLAANPALVSFHHIARIIMTTIEVSSAGRLLKMRD